MARLIATSAASAGVAAVALGAGLAIAGRAVYNRARSFDLEEAAGRVEGKLSD